VDRHRRSSGEARLDAIIQCLRLGDNVVWQVDLLEDYARFAQAFVAQALKEGMPCVYMRFAPHAPLLAEHPDIELVHVDPSSGFDIFSAQVHRLIEARGRGVAYVFDSLSTLVQPWATDELLANFFQVTCPYLYELDTIAYFALMRGNHSDETVAKIAATTQVMIDLYHVGGEAYVHPIKVVGRYAQQMFMPTRIEGEIWSPIFQTAHQQDGGPLGAVAGAVPDAAIAPWDSVYAQLLRWRQQAALGESGSSEVEALKVELRRMLMGDDEHLAPLADRYLTVDDLLNVRQRLIGSGRIGGKAVGMLLARRILCDESGAVGANEGVDFSEVLEDHDSFFIGSDVFFTFLVTNGLFRRRLETQRQMALSSASLSPNDFAQIEAQFMAGEFPDGILARFREMLVHYGETPIIVRSSSLFEDGFGHAFAGKYRSEFCANQGSIEARLEGLTRAVKRVYASALSPDALAYRRKQGLIESDERMAILVQRVSGRRHKNLFFPPLAGVAFSRNIYTWSDRIDARQGMVRLVFGLGTRAVDRVEDYPRMIALSHPHLRPQVGEEIVRYSQRSVDVIDLQNNAVRSMPPSEILDDGYPHLDLYVSQMADGYVQDAVSNLLSGSFRKRTLVLTFDRFLQRTEFVRVLRAMLATLEGVYGRPIDTEFTVLPGPNGDLLINLVQCRPMSLPGWPPGLAAPDVPSERVLFGANRMAGGGIVQDIGYIVYVDPAGYASIESKGLARGRLGRIIGELNTHPRLMAGKMMMMGPGRWGSSNPALGVNVSYADISNTAVLVEIAGGGHGSATPAGAGDWRSERRYAPEVSFGTHFFQDLVEDQIIYMPLYPDDPQSAYRAAFFTQAPNLLAELLPEAQDYAPVIKVIDVMAATGGLRAHVVADPGARRALCYLDG
jgi:pyruvate, water dikinase